MTVYERVLNRVKHQVSSEWLTESQAAVLKQVTGRFAHYPMINIFGGRGVGKTLLGWVLCREFGYAFVGSTEVEAWPPKAILDVESLSRATGRRIRGEMLLYEKDKVYVLTREPMNDAVIKIELGLTLDDIRKVKSNFLRFFDQQLLTDGSDLHELLMRNIREGFLI